MPQGTVASQPPDPAWPCNVDWYP
ncbi:hypothetical protein WJX75_003612 [Coccomyxa subellipsoidea]|uniref:Uncharacterized protein n=1 Tax=Coccomyxa subellipsoidea TaxID=248742 RepID=A0ABR2Z2Q3_9CHLO